MLSTLSDMMSMMSMSMSNNGQKKCMEENTNPRLEDLDRVKKTTRKSDTSELKIILVQLLNVKTIKSYHA